LYIVNAKDLYLPMNQWQNIRDFLETGKCRSRSKLLSRRRQPTYPRHQR